MGKLAKKYIKEAAKTVPSSQWKERGLKKAWALQKRAQKGGTKSKPKSKPRGKTAGRSSPRASPGGKTVTKSPKIGASIQAFKGAHSIVAPLLEAGHRTKAGAQLVPSLKRHANLDYAVSLGAEGMNQAVDRKIAHATALSGGSMTAWAAEAYAAWRVYEAAKGKDAVDAIRQTNISLSRTIRAYNPWTAKTELNDDFRNYQMLKIGGGIARRLSNMGPFKKIAAPAKKILSAFGGRL